MSNKKLHLLALLSLLSLLLLPHILLNTALLLCKYILENRPPSYFVSLTTIELEGQTECSALSLPFLPVVPSTPNHYPGSTIVDGAHMPGKASTIVSYIFKHINYDSVEAKWGLNWLSLDFDSLVINDLSLTPAVTATRLKVKLSLQLTRWLLHVSTFFRAGGGLGYGVFDVEAEGVKVKVKTGGVEARTYPFVTIQSDDNPAISYQVEPATYPTNLHPFVSRLPPFPTEHTFFKVGIVDAKDVEVSITSKRRLLHQKVYAIPEYLTNVTRVNRRGTDEWEGIDVVDFPLLIKKDIVAVLESAVPALGDLEDFRAFVRRGADWARQVVAEGGVRNVMENYGVGRRGRKKWVERLQLARQGSSRWWKGEAAPFLDSQRKKAEMWWKGEVVPLGKKVDLWWKAEAVPFLEAEKEMWQRRIRDWNRRQQGGKGGRGEGHHYLVLDE